MHLETSLEGTGRDGSGLEIKCQVGLKSNNRIGMMARAVNSCTPTNNAVESNQSVD